MIGAFSQTKDKSSSHDKDVKAFKEIWKGFFDNKHGQELLVKATGIAQGKKDGPGKSSPAADLLKGLFLKFYLTEWIMDMDKTYIVGLQMLPLWLPGAGE